MNDFSWLAVMYDINGVPCYACSENGVALCRTKKEAEAIVKGMTDAAPFEARGGVIKMRPYVCVERVPETSNG